MAEGFLTVILNGSMEVDVVEVPDGREVCPRTVKMEEPHVRAFFGKDVGFAPADKQVAAIIASLAMLDKAAQAIRAEADRCGIRIEEHRDATVQNIMAKANA